MIFALTVVDLSWRVCVCQAAALKLRSLLLGWVDTYMVGVLRKSHEVLRENMYHRYICHICLQGDISSPHNFIKHGKYFNYGATRHNLSQTEKHWECQWCFVFGCTLFIWPVEGACVSQLNGEVLNWFKCYKAKEIQASESMSWRNSGSEV